MYLYKELYHSPGLSLVLQDIQIHLTKKTIMEILALSYKIKAKSDFDTSVFYAFIEPTSAGNHVIEAKLLISTNDLSEYDSLICDSYSEAHRKAFLSQMSEKDYDFLYESQFAVDFPHEY